MSAAEDPLSPASPSLLSGEAEQGRQPRGAGRHALYFKLLAGNFPAENKEQQLPGRRAGAELSRGADALLIHRVPLMGRTRANVPIF